MSELSIKRLSSGYFHVRGRGPCEWGQYETWPPTNSDINDGTFVLASDRFRAAVREAAERAEE